MCVRVYVCVCVCVCVWVCGWVGGCMAILLPKLRSVHPECLFCCFQAIWALTAVAVFWLGVGHRRLSLFTQASDVYCVLTQFSRTHIHIPMHTYRSHSQTYTLTHTHTHTHSLTLTHTYIYEQTHSHTHARTHACALAYIRTHTHLPIHIDRWSNLSSMFTWAG